MTRSEKDRQKFAHRLTVFLRANGGSLSVEEMRRLGCTPVGFKSSPPKERRDRTLQFCAHDICITLPKKMRAKYWPSWMEWEKRAA